MAESTWWSKTAHLMVTKREREREREREGEKGREIDCFIIIKFHLPKPLSYKSISGFIH
jgi:hypothetical protein